jgi:membrane associated rhomboid family serine protease
MLFPIKSKNPPEAKPYVTMALIAINCIAFVLTSKGAFVRQDIIDTYALSMAHATPTTLIASMFLHADVFHLVGNMWFLYLFGFAVEGRLKWFKFTLLYFAAGFAGSGLQLALNVHYPNMPCLGASGAIMGTLGAALVLFPYSYYVFFYWIAWAWRGTVDWRMYWVAAYYLGLDALGLMFNPQGGIAYYAHFGGALAGVAMCYLFRAKRDSIEMSEVKATLDEYGTLEFLRIEELELMSETHPNDTKLAVHWAKRCSEDHRGLSQACAKHFVQLLPVILEKEPLSEVTETVVAVAQKPGALPPSVLLQIAVRNESLGDPRQVVALLGSVLDDPAARGSDKEVALYRMGLIAESKIKNEKQAIACYKNLVASYPFGAFTNQAIERLRALGQSIDAA